MKTIVVAYDENYGIGKNNDLLWGRDLPGDLQHFKKVTANGAIIMGRKTYESIGRPLPNRQNIVISKTMGSTDGVTVVGSLQDAYAAVDTERDIYVIGGGEVYALAIDSIDRIVATEVHASFEDIDIFFPVIVTDHWKEIARESHVADDTNRYAYDFVTYERV